MKKIRIFAVAAIFCLITSALNARATRQDAADVVVLMDTSGTVLPYYEVINRRVLQSIISKFVRIGDSFHLISFSAVPQYEMSQKINTEADLSRVVSRFMLLYQLGQSADFLSGINFAGQYMTRLPSQQEKILIVISDGIFNPPASSPYRNYTGEQVKTELAKISASIRAKGWKVYYVKLPFPSDAVIKDLDGAFYAGKLDAAGSLDRSDVDSVMASSGTASAGTDSSSNGQKGYVSDANAQNKAAARTNGQTRDNNTQPTNTETGRVDTVTGRTDRPTTASSGSNTTQDITEPPTTAGSNSTGNTIYAQNQAGTPGSSNMTEQNAENAAVSATGGQGTDTDTDSAGQGPREYTDVSQAFTENLGIEPSGLPEEGGVEFNDTTFPIPQIVFPDRIETSSNTAELPLTIINEAAEPTEIQLKSLSIGSDGKIQKQQLENIIVRIPPEGKSELTIRIALPDSLRREGHYCGAIFYGFCSPRWYLSLSCY